MSIMQKIFGITPPSAPPVNPNVQVNPNLNPALNPTNNLNTNVAPPNQNPPGNTAPNGVVPPNGEKPGESPGEKFKSLWEPVPVDKNAPTPPDNALTPEKMLEAAGKVDFKRVLDAESLAKIKAGGDEAVTALADLLNKTAQTVYGQSTVVAHKMIEQEVAKAKKEFAEGVPTLVRRQATRDTLIQDNPAFNNPAVQPVVKAIQTQLELKYPNASPAEIANLAKEYFKDAAGMFNPVVSVKEPQNLGDTVDWDEYASGKIGS